MSKIRIADLIEKLMREPNQNRLVDDPTEIGLIIRLNDEGVGEIYDDTYDIIIHCTSEEEQKKALKLLKKKTLELLKKL